MLESKVYCCYAELLRTAFFLFFLHSTPPPTLFQLPPSIYQTILDNHCSLRYFSLPYFSTSDLNETWNHAKSSKLKNQFTYGNWHFLEFSIDCDVYLQISVWGIYLLRNFGHFFNLNLAFRWKQAAWATSLFCLFFWLAHISLV